ncbi:MAG: hypothetical protein IT184_01195 [Acidobacteria bacterium]|nr:hypothetical protein [Acidobacteriota bacterium]
MLHPLRPTLVGVLVLCSLVWMAPGDLRAQADTRRIYVSVLDKDSKPVLDMQGAEFEVKEGGKAVSLGDVKLAARPVRVALIISDRGTGQFQGAALRFVEAVLGHGEVAITGISTQPERFSDYSDSVDVLREGLLRIGRRAMASGASAQLVEAILEATKDIDREGYRPAVVIMRNGGEGPTPVRAETVREAIRRTGAVLYAISTTGTQGIQRGNPTTPATAAGVAQAAAQSEVQEGMLTLGTILGEGSKDSGGYHDQVVATTLIPTMQRLAAELVNQYEITYTLPAGVKPNDRVSVSSKRKGLTVRAPTRIAN